MKDHGTNIERLVGLAYEPESDSPPRLALKLEGDQVKEAVKIAHRLGIPVRTNASLANALHSLEEDSYVPEKLFRAVAAVLREVLNSGRKNVVGKQSLR